VSGEEISPEAGEPEEREGVFPEESGEAPEPDGGSRISEVEETGPAEAAGDPESAEAVEAEAVGAPAAPEPIIQLSREDLRGALEAVLFSTGEPIPIRQLAELFEIGVHDVREVVEELRLEYVSSGRAFRVEEIAGGVQILTQAKYEPWVRRHLQSARDGRLSPAAFETLAVIAYKQPITKADLEAIRGVQCTPILKTLMDRNLVKIVGREETLGKPLLYGTTKRFLESFGISSLTNLPQPEIETPEIAPGNN
jgi:segregation and condensation protein B